MSQTVDLFLVYQFIKRLSTPFNETKAFRLGLIDEKGKKLKKASSSEEKNAMTYYDRLIFNLKRLLSKVGVESKFTTFAAALFLIKEGNKPKDKRVTYISESEFHEFKNENKRILLSLMNEDAPANAVGGGNIAGAGPGEDPPMRKKVIDRYRKKNKAQANTVGRKTFSMIRTA
jgi:hypothetical protein